MSSFDPSVSDGATERPLPPTYLRGRRTGWAAAPEALHRLVTDVLGGPVTGWQDRVGGMSVGVASVVHGAGRSVFVKALDGTHNPAGHEMYRREAATAALLPASRSIPQLLHAAEVDAPAGRWAANLFQAVPGDPPSHPWSGEALLRVLDAWAELAPALHAVRWNVPAGIGVFLGHWQRLVQDTDDPWYGLVKPWRERLEHVVTTLDGSPEHPAVLVHGDLRADNLLLSRGTARVWFADWAQPGRAAPWADPAILFADVLASGADRTDGGEIDVERVWRTHPATAGYDVELLRGTVVAIAAALHLGSRRPPNPLFPHQRGWERAMADHLAPYLARHAG